MFPIKIAFCLCSSRQIFVTCYLHLSSERLVDVSAESVIKTLLKVIELTGWPASNHSKSADSYGIGAFDDEIDWSQHPCKRECKENAAPMTCRYGFTIENYSTMSKACFDCPRNVTDCFRPHCLPGDGSNRRMVLVANRLLPGPSIEVCLGDRIVVDVTNNLIAEATTLHWHGLHQRGTPFMDGVPMISQCPIASGDSFRYDFKADVAGTMFWHAHSGLQRSDGLFGALIVRKSASKNQVGHLYDQDEHVILLNEWSDFLGTEAYVMQYASGVPTQPHTLLINGLGPYGNDSISARIPRPIFRVKKNSRHRIRLINAGAHICMFYITVDQHPLLVISADGADVEPVEVDAIRLTPGERYDFVLNASREVGNYWMRVSADVTCSYRQVHQEAIIRYEGAPETEPTEPIGYRIGFEPEKRMLNPFEQGSETKGAMCISCSLKSLEPDDVSLAPTPDHQFYLPYDFYIVNATHDYHRKGLYEYYQVPLGSKSQMTSLLKGLSFETPKFPVQTQPELIGPDYLCNMTEARCTREHCSCPHVLQLKLNSTVELVLIDQGLHNSEPRILPAFKISHPMHLHGFHYRVLAMEKVGNTTTVEQVRALDLAGRLRRNFKAAPKKDVLNVPSGGYAVIRFRADNPGYWFFHCHYEKHAHNGMAMVLKVGEHKDFPPVPKDFPKCHYHA